MCSMVWSNTEQGRSWYHNAKGLSLSPSLPPFHPHELNLSLSLSLSLFSLYLSKLL